VCSVDRVPIKAHGNHYHRKGCIDYKPWIDEKTKKEITKEEKDFKNCQKCKENKTGCKYPISLDEYKK
jgi:phage anti-repressor protein